MPLRHLIRVSVLAAYLALAAPAASHAGGADFTLWQQLLQRYAKQVSGKGQAIDTRFDYEQLYVDEGIWTTRRAPTLEHIRDQMFAVPPEGMSAAERRAWAINAYNFLVVERATMKLLVPGRRFLRYRSVNEMLWSDGSFFQAKVVTLGDREYSIAEFERAFVLEDPAMPPEARSKAGDPRVHFAICPGAVGGPPLWLRAFRADSLEAQLGQVTRNALASSAWVRLSEPKDDFEASDALAGFRIDMGGDDAGILAFLLRHGTKDTQSIIRRRKLTSVPRYFAYDWALNQLERPRQAAPAGAPGDSTRGM